MAALEAVRTNFSLQWSWDIDNNASDTTDTLEKLHSLDSLKEALAKPYQVWTKSQTGTYSIIAPNARAALATIEELSAAKHTDISVRDMDGNEVDIRVLQAMIDLEASRILRLVPR
jgi:hypothetical protein